MYLIYKHTSPSNKSYIGQTCRLILREKEHCRAVGDSPAFHNAILKYGWDNFTHEILEENLTLEEANEREVYWIDFYNSLSPNGYNLTTGGKNTKLSEESCKKMSESKLGEKNYFYGKIGELHHNYGRKHTEEQKKSQSERSSGENNPMYGKIRTIESRNKQKLTNSKIYIITFPDEHEEIIIGLKQFCLLNNLSQGAMYSVIINKRKHHKNYKCRYATEEEYNNVQ